MLIKLATNCQPTPTPTVSVA